MYLDKKIVLVTGGTSGIGYATVEYLIEDGNYEIVSASRKEENINKAKEILGEKAKFVTFIKADVSKENDCKMIYKEIKNKYGRLDGLVNCAGIIKAGGIEHAKLEEWIEVININLTSMFILTKELLPLLKLGKNASIVNISSMASQVIGCSIAYGVSKSGVDTFTKYLADELGKYKIRVTEVTPAAVYTNIYVANGICTQEEYDKVSKERAKEYSLGRIGNAKEDIAPTIEFLLSDKSPWTTGSNYLITGGRKD